MRYKWFEVKYEGDAYDVCVDTNGLSGFDVEEIRPTDSEINIIPVMDDKTVRWFWAESLMQFQEENTLNKYNKEYDKSDYFPDVKFPSIRKEVA